MTSLCSETLRQCTGSFPQPGPSFTRWWPPFPRVISQGPELACSHPVCLSPPFFSSEYYFKCILAYGHHHILYSMYKVWNYGVTGSMYYIAFLFRSFLLKYMCQQGRASSERNSLSLKGLVLLPCLFLIYRGNSYIPWLVVA